MFRHRGAKLGNLQNKGISAQHINLVITLSEFVGWLISRRNTQGMSNFKTHHNAD